MKALIIAFLKISMNHDTNVREKKLSDNEKGTKQSLPLKNIENHCIVAYNYTESTAKPQLSGQCYTV